jgi:hypothetical protein
VIDEVLAGARGDDQGGDGDVVDGSGLAAAAWSGSRDDAAVADKYVHVLVGRR